MPEFLCDLLDVGRLLGEAHTARQRHGELDHGLRLAARVTVAGLDCGEHAPKPATPTR